MTTDTAKLRAETLARMENARRDDCLDRMVPSDLRILLGDTLPLLDEIERLREKLRFYANPEIYKPHPHGPAFDRRELSFVARAALGEGGLDDH